MEPAHDTAAPILIDATHNVIYLMGASFILGSMLTLFLLLVLDFVRRSKHTPEE